MAKVYDALKQVEAERSRQLRAMARPPAGVPNSEPRFWQRWSGRLNGNGNGGAGANGNGDGHAVEAAAAPDLGVRQHLDAILGRIDAFEHMARQRLPELERNLHQVLEDRIEMVEREMAASVSTLGNQMRREVAGLNRRVSVLLGAVAVLLVALLLRG